jgi:hypothetical protein
LPHPDSPKISTRPLVGAISLICWRSALMGTLSPVIERVGVELAVKLLVLMAQPARIDRILDQDQRAVERQRLFQEIESPKLGCPTAVSIVPWPEMMITSGLASSA